MTCLVNKSETRLYSKVPLCRKLITSRHETSGTPVWRYNADCVPHVFVRWGRKIANGFERRIRGREREDLIQVEEYGWDRKMSSSYGLARLASCFPCLFRRVEDAPHSRFRCSVYVLGCLSSLYETTVYASQVARHARFSSLFFTHLLLPTSKCGISSFQNDLVLSSAIDRSIFKCLIRQRETFSYSLTFNVHKLRLNQSILCVILLIVYQTQLDIVLFTTGYGATIIANSTTSMDNKTVDIPVAKVQEMVVVAKVESQPLPPPQSMNLEASDQPKQQADEKIPTSLGPQFIPEASKNVTSLAGRVASLNCRIKNLDNWTVCQYLPRATVLSWQQLPSHWNKKRFILVGVG